MKKVAKRVAVRAVALLGHLPAGDRDWRGLSSIRSAALLCTGGLGMGDLLMASALFRPLRERGIPITVVGSKYPALFEDIPNVSLSALGEVPDLCLIPDYSLRNLQYLKLLRQTRFWTGFAYDWRLRGNFDCANFGEAVNWKGHWQNRVELIADALDLKGMDLAYWDRLRCEPIEKPSRYLLLNLVTDQSIRGLRADTYRQIFDRFQARGLQAVLVGDARFTDTLGKMGLSHPAVISMVGRTSVYQLNTLIQDSLGYVGIDSGPMHIAYALRKPVFALMKGVLPEWRRPRFYRPGESFYAYSPCEYKGTQVCYDPLGGFPRMCPGCTESESFEALEPALDQFLAGLENA